MEGIELPNQERIRMIGEKETYKYLGILEVNSIKQMGMKEKRKKGVSQMNEKTSGNQTQQQESHHKDKLLSCPPCKILGTILEMD